MACIEPQEWWPNPARLDGRAIIAELIPGLPAKDINIKVMFGSNVEWQHKLIHDGRIRIKVIRDQNNIPYLHFTQDPILVDYYISPVGFAAGDQKSRLEFEDTPQGWIMIGTDDYRPNRVRKYRYELEKCSVLLKYCKPELSLIHCCDGNCPSGIDDCYSVSLYPQPQP